MILKYNKIKNKALSLESNKNDYSIIHENKKDNEKTLSNS